jgi:predicted house-cleaning noncanonical NTP pyrophosphatase (MazG superfamily)
MYGGQEYELILSNGEKCKARVDDSREFMSEGLEWKLLTSTDNYSANTNVEQYVVVAWKRI